MCLELMRTAIDVTRAKPSPTARQLTDMAVRVRRSVDRAETMIEALLALAVSDQGKLSTESPTWPPGPRTRSTPPLLKSKA